MEILKENPSVYVQMNCVDEFISGSHENPCAFCWRYDSVMGAGEVEFLEPYDPASRQDRGLFSIPCRKIKAYLRLPCLH